MTPLYIDQGRLASESPVVWYAAPGPQPEDGVYLRVETLRAGLTDADEPGCLLGGPHRNTTLLANGTPMCLDLRDSDDPTGTIAVNLVPDVVIIHGSATDAQLMAAAENLFLSPELGGYEVGADGLPLEVAFLGSGFGISDFATGTDDDGQIQVVFSDGEDGSIFYVASPAESESFATLRLGFGSITDVTVRGVPGIVRTIDDQAAYVGVVWHADGITYQVGSQRLGRQETLDLVEEFQPATQADWVAAIAATPEPEIMEEETPPTTTIVRQSEEE